MKKQDCEQVIRPLVGLWAQTQGEDPSKLSFNDFFGWLQDKHPEYLRFRTSTSVSYDVEMWFDDELGQAWKN